MLLLLLLFVLELLVLLLLLVVLVLLELMLLLLVVAVAVVVVPLLVAGDGDGVMVRPVLLAVSARRSRLLSAAGDGAGVMVNAGSRPDPKLKSTTSSTSILAIFARRVVVILYVDQLQGARTNRLIS